MIVRKRWILPLLLALSGFACVFSKSGPQTLDQNKSQAQPQTKSPDETTIEGAATLKAYRDSDGDGFGNPADAVDRQGDAAPAGYVNDHTDCDDAKKDIHPQAMEVYADGIDQNCDGYFLKIPKKGSLVMNARHSSTNAKGEIQFDPSTNKIGLGVTMSTLEEGRGEETHSFRMNGQYDAGQRTMTSPIELADGANWKTEGSLFWKTDDRGRLIQMILGDKDGNTDRRYEWDYTVPNKLLYRVFGDNNETQDVVEKTFNEGGQVLSEKKLSSDDARMHTYLFGVSTLDGREITRVSYEIPERAVYSTVTTSANGRMISREYHRGDENGRLMLQESWTYDDATQARKSYEMKGYDPDANNVTSCTHEDYDAAERLAARRLYRDSDCPTIVPPYEDTTLVRDSSGRVIMETHKRKKDGDGYDERKREWTYDAEGNITRVVVTDGIENLSMTLDLSDYAGLPFEIFWPGDTGDVVPFILPLDGILMDPTKVSSLNSKMTEPRPLNAIARPAQRAAAAVPAENANFHVVIKTIDDAKKIQVIKIIREYTGMMLAEAKGVIDAGLPAEVNHGLTEAQANKMKIDLEAAGATAEIKAL